MIQIIAGMIGQSGSFRDSVSPLTVDKLSREQYWPILNGLYWQFAGGPVVRVVGLLLQRAQLGRYVDTQGGLCISGAIVCSLSQSNPSYPYYLASSRSAMSSASSSHLVLYVYLCFTSYFSLAISYQSGTVYSRG